MYRCHYTSIIDLEVFNDVTMFLRVWSIASFGGLGSTVVRCWSWRRRPRSLNPSEYATGDRMGVVMVMVMGVRGGGGVRSYNKTIPLTPPSEVKNSRTMNAKQRNTEQLHRKHYINEHPDT